MTLSTIIYLLAFVSILLVCIAWVFGNRKDDDR